MSAKRSRVHPKYKGRYRVRNWSAYDTVLVRRGDLTLWLTPEPVAAWHPASAGRRGAQPKSLDLAIETAQTLRPLFHLPLRQTEGFLRSILRLMGLDLEAPDHTTLSRRRRHLDIDLWALTGTGPLHLVIERLPRLSARG